MSYNGSEDEPVSVNQQQDSTVAESESLVAGEAASRQPDTAAKEADTTATSYHTTVASLTSFNASQEVSVSRLDCSGEELVFSDDNMGEDNLDIHAEMSDEELSSSKGRGAHKEQPAPSSSGNTVEPAASAAAAEAKEEQPKKPRKPRKRGHAWGLKKSGLRPAHIITSKAMDEMLPGNKPDLSSVLRERPRGKRELGGSDAEDGELEEGEVNEAAAKAQQKNKRPAPPKEQESSAKESESSAKEMESSAKEMKASAKEQEANAEESSEPEAKAESGGKEPTPEKAPRLRETKVVDYLVDEPIREGPPREAQYAESPIVKVVGLVRPFTPNQLQDLLSRYGRLSDSAEQRGFWLDRIKTRCYATFQSVEEAKKAREELDNCKWPRLNPKPLQVDFSTSDELQWALQHGDTGQQVPKQVARVGRVKEPEPSPKSPERKRRHEEAEDQKEAANHQRRRSSRTPTGSPAQKSPKEANNHKANRKASPEDRRRVERLPKDRQRQRSRSRSQSERRRKSPAKAKKERRSTEPDSEVAPGCRRSPEARGEPGKLLDQLFRKTAATPFIYWMPLSDEQIAAREEERKRKVESATSAPAGGGRRRSASASPRRGGEQRRYTRIDAGGARDRRRR